MKLREFLAITILVGVSQSTLAEEKSLPKMNIGDTVHNDIRELSKNAKPSMLFTGNSGLEFDTWHREFRRKLNELLGPHKPPQRWETIQDSKEEFDDHIRLHLTLKADGLPSLPLYLLIPKDVSEAAPAPAVLCVHGHGNYGYHPIVGRTDIAGVEENIEQCNYDYGLQFVRRGYVVAAPCMIPFGPRVDRKKYGSDPCATTFVRMQAFGQLPISANLRDLRWSISLLESLPEVNAQRIGCAGLSYGGRMTMMVTAVDDRIKVASVSGALNLLQERMSLRHSCGSQIVPGLLKYGDYAEIGSLIAPRPCVWEVGSKDSLIVPVWSDRFRDRLRRAYRASGKIDHLKFDDFEGGHRWSGVVAFPLFDAVLKKPAQRN